MPEWQADTFKKGAVALTNAFRGSTSRRKAAMSFAKRHQLIYFQTVQPDDDETKTMRSTSSAPDQIDSNYCIGSHAEYDMTLFERLATASFGEYKPTIHRWLVLQIDLKKARDLPFIFLGTKQQTKAYYARMLTAHREARYLSLSSASSNSASFHATYALLASPAELPLLYRLFTDDTIDSVATYKHPFAVEIDGDTLTITTESLKASEQLLDELLHYGLWFAKTIDSRLA